jgi:hypothetical protein
MTKAAEARVAEEQLRHYGTHTYLTLSPLCLRLSRNCAVSACVLMHPGVGLVTGPALLNLYVTTGVLISP